MSTESFIGVDLGKTSIRATRYVFDSAVDGSQSINPLQRSQPIRTPLTGIGDIVDGCVGMVNSLLSSAGEVAAIGIGTFGIVDPTRGVVIKSGTLPFWNGVGLADLMTTKVERPCFVLNDVAAAAAGIRCLRNPTDNSSFVLVQLGTSVGVSGCGGHLDPLWHRPDFGQVSRLLDVSGLDLATQLGGRGLEWRGTRQAGKQLTSSEIFSRARRGDPELAKLVKSFSLRLVELLAEVAALLVPDRILLGGGVAKGVDQVLDFVQKEYEDRTSFLWHRPSLEMASWDDGPEIGAASWAREKWNSRFPD